MYPPKKNAYLPTHQQKGWVGKCPTNNFLIVTSGIFFFQLFNWFQLFSSRKKNWKVAENGHNRSKIDHLEGGVDGFSKFFFNDFQLFYFLTRFIPDICFHLKSVQWTWQQLKPVSILNTQLYKDTPNCNKHFNDIQEDSLWVFLALINDLF